VLQRNFLNAAAHVLLRFSGGCSELSAPSSVSDDQA